MTFLTRVLARCERRIPRGALGEEVNSLRQKRLEQAPKELNQQWVSSIMQLESIADKLQSEGFKGDQARRPWDSLEAVSDLLKS